jgi:hypothetical protein
MLAGVFLQNKPLLQKKNQLFLRAQAPKETRKRINALSPSQKK